MFEEGKLIFLSLVVEEKSSKYYNIKNKITIFLLNPYSGSSEKWRSAQLGLKRDR